MTKLLLAPFLHARLWVMIQFSKSYKNTKNRSQYSSMSYLYEHLYRVNFIEHFLREFLKGGYLSPFTIQTAYRYYPYFFFFSIEHIKQSCFALGIQNSHVLHWLYRTLVFWHLHSEREILQIHNFSACSQLSLIKIKLTYLALTLESFKIPFKKTLSDHKTSNVHFI